MKTHKLMNILFVLLLAASFIMCSTVNDHSEKNVALIDNYVKAVEKLDYEFMKTLLHDDYLGIGPSYGDSVNKIEAAENWKNYVENLYKKIEYKHSRSFAIDVDEGENQGEWVSNWAELYIEFQNEVESVTIWANTIYQIQDGKIIKSYTFYNEADALRQLGYVFIDPNEFIYN